jgi:hypothetical protein
MQTEYKTLLITAIWEEYNQRFIPMLYSESVYDRALRYTGRKDPRRVRAKAKKIKTSTIKTQKAHNHELTKQLQWVLKLS